MLYKAGMTSADLPFSCKKGENFRRTSQYSCTKVGMRAADLLILNVKVNNAKC